MANESEPIFEFLDETPDVLTVRNPKGTVIPIAKNAISSDDLSDVRKNIKPEKKPERVDDFQYMMQSLSGTSPESRDQYEKDVASLPKTMGEQTQRENAQKTEPQAPIPQKEPAQTPEGQEAPKAETGSQVGAGDLLSQGISNVTEGMLEKTVGDILQNNSNKKILADQVKAEESRQKFYNDLQTSYIKQVDSLYNDVASQKINPNRLWQNSSTGNKILAAVSIILGGISQGHTGAAENPAMKVINQLIDRDIDAQEKNLNNKITLLGVKRQQLGDIRLAREAARLDLQTLVNAQMMSAAAKTGNTQLIGQMKENLGKLQLEYLPMFQKITQQGLMNRIYQGGIPVAQEDIAVLNSIDPHYAEKRVKIGDTAYQAASVDEAKTLRTKAAVTDAVLADLKELEKAGRGKLIAGTDDYNRAKAAIGRLQTEIPAAATVVKVNDSELEAALHSIQGGWFNELANVNARLAPFRKSLLNSQETLRQQLIPNYQSIRERKFK